MDGDGFLVLTQEYSSHRAPTHLRHRDIRSLDAEIGGWKKRLKSRCRKDNCYTMDQYVLLIVSMVCKVVVPYTTNCNDYDAYRLTEAGWGIVTYEFILSWQVEDRVVIQI